MTKTEAQEAIIGTLSTLQALSGRQCGVITPKTRPIGHLEGFDSLNGIEATCELARHLGIGLDDTENIFVDETGRRSLVVEEVAERICERVNRESTK